MFVVELKQTNLLGNGYQHPHLHLVSQEALISMKK
jgi:hypothetical protein